jgi:hypothetical protein
MRRIVGVALTALAIVSWPAVNEARFISPRIIMFYGEPLRSPIYITGEDSRVFHDIESPTDLRPAGFSNRRFIQVAMFWGTQWDPYYFGKLPMKGVTPDKAGQHGRLYLTDNESVPVLLQTRPSLKAVAMPKDSNEFSWGGAIPSESVALLGRYGVPTRIQ